MLAELGASAKHVLDNHVVLTIGILLGFIAALILSSLLLFLLSKHRKFLLLASGLLSQALGLTIYYGYIPITGWWHDTVILSLCSIYLICATYYAYAQMVIKRYAPRLVKFVRSLVILGSAVLVVNWFLPRVAGELLLLTFAWLSILIMVSIGSWGWRQQMRTAKWFTLAWLLLGLAVTDVTYAKVVDEAIGILEINALVCLFWLANVLWFMGAITVYVDDKKIKIAQQQRDLNQAQQQKELQKQKFEMEEQMREELELKVQERSFELEVTLRELEDKNRELEEKNTQDALTGMRNRRFFDKKYLAETRRSRREQSILSIVMMDIDHFKKVNDVHGHLAGDDVIRFVGRTITNMLKRPSDEGCRYGGEEFALILPNTGEEGAILVAESIRKQIADSDIETQAGLLKVTISCGICTAVSERDMTANHYIELADKALYQAKHSGRNKVIHFSDCADLTRASS